MSHEPSGNVQVLNGILSFGDEPFPSIPITDRVSNPRVRSQCLDQSENRPAGDVSSPARISRGTETVRRAIIDSIDGGDVINCQYGCARVKDHWVSVSGSSSQSEDVTISDLIISIGSLRMPTRAMLSRRDEKYFVRAARWAMLAPVSIVFDAKRRVSHR
jgi:hypothetical protein